MVGNERQLLLGLLEHRIPSEAGGRVVVGRVESIGSHAGSPEVLEDISQQEDVGLEIEIGVVTKRRDVKFLKQ